MRWTRQRARRARPAGVRPSRVVLTPRCWRQVGDKKRRRRGQTSLVTGESTKETVKPLRRECRVYSGVTVVTTLVCFVLFRTRGCGCIGHPAFPAPSVDRGTNGSCMTRTHRAARLRSRISNPSCLRNGFAVIAGGASAASLEGSAAGPSPFETAALRPPQGDGDSVIGPLRWNVSCSRHQNGLLRNFEPFSPYRQGSSTALVRPIRSPAMTSGLPARACSAIGEASSGRPLC